MAEEGADLPGRVYQVPAYREFVDATALIFAWNNDIISYEAELASGEINNLLVLLGRQHGMTAQHDNVRYWLLDV